MLLMLAGCNKNTFPSDKIPDDAPFRFCVIGYSSYVGAFSDLESFFHVLIYVPHQKSVGDDPSTFSMTMINDYSYALVSDIDTAVVHLLRVSLYMSGDKGDLYRMRFGTSNLSTGLFYFTDIEIEHRRTMQKTRHSIGDWCFDVRQAPANEYIELTAASLQTGWYLDFFGVSFVNNGSKDIEILGADIILEGKVIKPGIAVYETFDSMMQNVDQVTSDDCMVIKPGQNRTFRFDYSDSGISRPVFLRAFFLYDSADGPLYYLPLNPMEYLPIPDEEILYKLALNGQGLPGNQ